MDTTMLEKYWDDIAGSENVEQLRFTVNARRDLADAALADVLHMLEHLEPIAVSRVANQLRWLGIQLSDATGNRAAGARLQGSRLLAAGREALDLGNRQRVVDLFSQAGAMAVQGDSAEAAIAITHQAVAMLFSLGAAEAGVDAGRALIDALEQWGSTSGAARVAISSFTRLSYRAPATSGWVDVISRMRRWLEQAGDPASVLVTCHLAAALIHQGAYEDGLEELGDSADMLLGLRQKLADGTVKSPPELFESRFWWARALDLSGRKTEAEQAYRAQPDFGQGSDATIRLVELLIENNRIQEALDLLQSFAAQDVNLRALAHALLSVAYAQLNRFEASEAASRDALSMLESTAEPADELPSLRQKVSQGVRRIWQFFLPDEMQWRTHLTVIEAAAVRGQVNGEQLAKLEETLAWARQFARREMEARCLRCQGEVTLGSGKADAAMSIFAESLQCELNTAGSNEWKKFRSGRPEPDSLREELYLDALRRMRQEAGVGIESLFGLGRAKAAAGGDPTVEFDAVIATAKRRNRRLTLFFAQAAKARWLIASGENEEARKLFEVAADVLEGLRAEFYTIESQVGVMENKENIYGELLLASVRSCNAQLAMRLMERSKARGLLEEMGVQEGGQPLRVEEEQEVRTLRQQLVRLKPLEGDQFMEGELIRGRLASVYRSKRPKLERRPGGRAEDAVRLSGSRCAVIHYFVSESGVVGAAAFNGQLLPPMQLNCTKEQLTRTFEALQFEISTFDRCYSLTQLYAALIQPLEQYLDGVKRIIFVPHDILHLLPLHAALCPDGKYLLERCPIQYAPSVAISLKAARGSAPGDLSGALFLAADQVVYRNELPQLPYARIEVERASSFFAEAKVMLGANALRRHLLRQERDLAVLHLACHGEFDDKDPLLSRVYLADGPLYGYEIERMPWCPRLAVLSACETGIQRRAAGDETFGLVRTLLSRGTEAVIASLWRVGDESTAQLMSCFYECLSRCPSDVAGALRHAQLQLLANSAYAHPFFWAPYVLIGGTGCHIPITEDTSL